VTLAMPPFQKFVVRCVWTVTGNVHVKNEVRIALMQLTESTTMYVGSNWPRLPVGVIKLGFPSKG